MKKYLIIVSIVCLFVSCHLVTPTDPFLNVENSGTVVNYKSFYDGKTVNIFSTESLSIAVYLREHISEYTVHIDDNRLWKSADKIITSDQIKTSPILYYFSFRDTGTKKITITTKLKDGSTKDVKTFTLHAVSPLSQDKIIAKQGDSLVLKTATVSDQVTYVWDLKNGETIRSASPVVKIILGKSFVYGTGELYVADGAQESRSVMFELSDPQIDTIGLAIVSPDCIRDTIRTEDSAYTLKINLSGTPSIKSATVNGSPFSIEKTDSSIHLLSATLKGYKEDTLYHPQHIVIIDNYDRAIFDTIYVKNKRTDGNIDSIKPTPVKWSATSGQFVTLYEAGVDTLSLLLKIDSLTGCKPFTFTGSIDGKVIPVSTEGQYGVRVKWQPEKEDIGTKILKVTVRDSLQTADEFTVTIRIVSPPVPVKWKINKDEIDTQLIALIDTLNAVLKTDSLTGCKPFQFKVYISDKEITTVSKGTHSVNVQWAPKTSDIGVKTFKVIVEDSLHSSDTFMVALNVGFPPVKWRPKPANLDTQFIADVDTMKMTIRLDSLYGCKPFKFKVSLDNVEIQSTAEGIYGVQSEWAPTMSEIGTKTLKIIAEDSLHSTDTFSVKLKVVTPPDLQLKWNPEVISVRESNVSGIIQATLSRRALTTTKVMCILNSHESTISNKDVSIADTSYLIFNRGDSVASIPYTVFNDDILEQDEKFVLDFAKMPDYVKPTSPGKLTFNIVDDDKVSFSFESNSNSGLENVTIHNIPVTLSRTAPMDMVINFTVATGSTASSSDYSLQSNSIVIPANQTEGQLQVNIFNDSLYENNETVIIDVSTQAFFGSTGINGRCIYTIKNDDTTKSVISFAPAPSTGPIVRISESDNSKPAELVVNLSRPSGVPIGFSFGTISGPSPDLTAEYNVDCYLMADGWVKFPNDIITFEPGTTSKTLLLFPTKDQTPPENDEQITFTIKSISNSNASLIGTPSERKFVVNRN